MEETYGRWAGEGSQYARFTWWRFRKTYTLRWTFLDARDTGFDCITGRSSTATPHERERQLPRLGHNDGVSGCRTGRS